MQGVGQGEHHQAAGHHQDRVQAAGQVDTIDQLQHQPAAAQAHQAANAELAQQVGEQAPVQAGLAAGDHVDQGHGEEHRHRVVAARFDFQGGGDPFVKPLAAQQREHRRGVGGADDGADQQALDQAQVEQPGGDHAGQPGGDQHAHRGQRQRRPQRHAEARHPGAQAAVEQDDRKRQVAHQVGGRVIVEDDAATVHARDHADGEDDDQDGDAQARGQRADQDTCAHQQCADQEQAVDGACIQRQVLRDSGKGTCNCELAGRVPIDSNLMNWQAVKRFCRCRKGTSKGAFSCVVSAGPSRMNPLLQGATRL